MLDLQPGHVVAAALGAVMAAVLLIPFRRSLARERRCWPQIGAAAVAVVILLPVVLVLFEQTQHFRARGLKEVGSAAFEEPPMSEAAARAVRSALRPGDSWAIVTFRGRCSGEDVYPFYWLAFRLVPNPPDCADPDVELYLRVDPSRGPTIVAQGPEFSVVRS